MGTRSSRETAAEAKEEAPASAETTEEVKPAETWVYCPLMGRLLGSSKGPALKALLDEMRDNNDIHPHFDLRFTKHHAWAKQTAELMLDGGATQLLDASDEKEDEKLVRRRKVEGLIALFKECRGDGRDADGSRYPMAFSIGVMNAASRLCAQSIEEPLKVTVVFAMYNESRRMQPMEDTETGEDCVRRKVAQLSWLYADTSVDWRLLAVDDGCHMQPLASGPMAQQIIDEELAKGTPGFDRMRVSFLQTAIDDKIPDFSDLTSTKDSRKGGAIQYGFYQGAVAEDGDAADVVVFTDCDLAADLSLCALLIEPLLAGGGSPVAHMSFGERYAYGLLDNNTVFGHRDPNYVALTVRHLFRGKLLPPIASVVDTQCGFKALRGDALCKVFGGLKTRDASFDTQLFLDVFAAGFGVAKEVAIPWVESPLESNWESNRVFYEKLTNTYVVNIYKQVRELLAVHRSIFETADGSEPHALASACAVDKEYVALIASLTEAQFCHFVAVLFADFVADRSSLTMATAPTTLTLEKVKELLARAEAVDSWEEEVE